MTEIFEESIDWAEQDLYSLLAGMRENIPEAIAEAKRRGLPSLPNR